METWRLTIEPWRVCRPVVADSHHFDEEQDQDPQYSEEFKKRRIRIRIKLMRTRNPVVPPLQSPSGPSEFFPRAFLFLG